MARKKEIKKKVKKVVKKKTVKKKIVRKVKPRVIKKPVVVSKPSVVKKPIQQDVMKRLDQEVRKPGLGESKGVKDKKFIPERKFVERRDKKFIPRRPERKFVPRKPGERKFVKPGERRFAPRDRRFSKPRFEKQDFKSHGEREISKFLKEERIHFLYEYPLAITDEDRKVRVWYPDFWLPELNIIIEYIGMKGKGDYDRASMRKKKIYNALKIDFIEITPGLIVKGNWKRFIAMKIIDIMRSKNYLYNKMKVLSKKYRIHVEDKAKENVGLEILD